eukprot:TRINITY_DN2347_c0_g1_i2.p1 TRINITY_DN2347_c0_g1~~TRINITY_DN2347_c0_g1_i2.p1  ORF type:complete len:298 (+),score=79.97 TRINITY_DN2347_c0_g1_i2:94-987(+)
MSASTVREAVLTPSTHKEGESIKGVEISKENQVCGFEWEESLKEELLDFDLLMKSYRTTGFQATSLGKSIEEINKMLNWRLSDEEILETDSEEEREMNYRREKKCTIFLGYTSNLVSSGLRETIKFLVKNKMVDAIVSSAGGIEEDFIKCLAPTYLGDFSLSGSSLRLSMLNRIGNLVVPNDNYCKFEDWVVPILDQLLEDQKKEGTLWTPSKVIARLGKEINHEDSIYYWAYKNNIPVFCPALTDGSLGDMMYFHSYKSPGLVVDIVSDIREINNIAVKAKKSGSVQHLLTDLWEI